LNILVLFVIYLWKRIASYCI